MTDGTNLPKASIRLPGSGARRMAALLDGVGLAPGDTPGPWMGSQARLRVTQDGVEVAVEYGGSGHLSTSDAERYAPVVAAVGTDGATAYTQALVRVMPDDEIEVVIRGEGLTAEPDLPQHGKTGVNLPVLVGYLVLVAAAIAVAVLASGVARIVAGVFAAVLLVLGGAMFGTGVVFWTMTRSIDRSMELDRFVD